MRSQTSKDSIKDPSEERRGGRGKAEGVRQAGSRRKSDLPSFSGVQCSLRDEAQLHKQICASCETEAAGKQEGLA